MIAFLTLVWVTVLYGGPTGDLAQDDQQYVKCMAYYHDSGHCISDVYRVEF